MSRGNATQPGRPASGSGFRGVLVFAYHILPEIAIQDDVPDLWEWHGRRYLLRAVAADDYCRAMRSRSPRWGTVSLPGAIFRELARPFCRLMESKGVPQLEECPFLSRGRKPPSLRAR